MPRFAAADAVKALLYCGEAFVDLRLELIVSTVSTRGTN